MSYLKPPLNPSFMAYLSTITFLAITILALLPSANSESVHDLLVRKGLPAGLLPKVVKSYTYEENGLLEVILEQPCLATYENRVFFERVIKANLTYGGLTGMEGLAQEELFLWLPIKDIIVDDPESGLILFDVGVVHKQFSLSLFDIPPECHNDDGIALDAKSGLTRKQKSFESMK